MDDWAELDRALGIIAGSERAEVREDGKWLADFTPLRFEIRRQGKNALVHLWSAERSHSASAMRQRVIERAYSARRPAIWTRKARPAGILMRGCAAACGPNLARAVLHEHSPHPGRVFSRCVHRIAHGHTGPQELLFRP